MDSCCEDKACELEELRKQQSNVLWVVFAINAVMFVLEFSIGFIAGSVALLADSLDMLGDTLVYGFSLFVITRSETWKVYAALLKGCIMLIFGLGVLGQAAYKFFMNGIPDAQIMGIISLVALAANTTCLFLLMSRRNDDLNMRSTWLCSRNDIVANTGAFIAAVGVYLTVSRWPDLIIGLIITIIFIKSAWYVLREAIGQICTVYKDKQTYPEVSIGTQLCKAGTCPIDACKCPTI